MGERSVSCSLKKTNIFYKIFKGERLEIFRSVFCVGRTACVHDRTVPVCFLCADDQEWESLDCVNVIPFLTSSTRMHPTIPIHTMLCPEDCTASCDANLSRERFVPFGRTFSAPYSQLDTRQSSLAYLTNINEMC